MKNYRYIVKCGAGKAEKPVEYSKFKKTVLSSNMNEVEKAIQGIPLDIEDWLPQAAKEYNISKNLEDYVIVPVIAFFSDLPNRNCVAFPLEELIKFNTEAGCMTYKTWKGKPTFMEHKNDVLKDAKGVIFDSVIRNVDEYQGDLVKVILLAGYDKTKDPELCRQILNRERDSYSMGAYADTFTCSICGKDLSKGGCSHIDLANPDMSIIDGKLAYMNGRGLMGFELSSVLNPAFVTATNPSYVEVSKI